LPDTRGMTMTDDVEVLKSDFLNALRYAELEWIKLNKKLKRSPSPWMQDEIHERASNIGFENAAIEVAKKIIDQPYLSPAFLLLVAEERLEISVEAIVWECEKYLPLFDEDYRKRAHDRLDEAKYFDEKGPYQAKKHPIC
jgi:hypothetical protein